MARTHRLAVVLEIETADPALSGAALDRSHDSARATEALRVAILRALPKGVKRVVLVTSPDLMKSLLTTHELAAEIAGVPDMFSRPPDDYDPPDGR
jgi:hypothetical protein